MDGGGEDQRAGATLTIIIPTYNRRVLLMHTLACLERQTVRGFRVIVVDDGSTDDTQTAMAAFMACSSLAIDYRRQSNAGPARARNLGLSMVRTPLVAMIGDDTWPEQGFVAAHIAFHRANPDPRDAAVGHTRWCDALQTVTPFMRWLDMDGVQFAYRELLAGGPAGWGHFYTSNLSAKAVLLGPHLFDERFPGAAMEDLEAGYRLVAQRGMRVTFLRDAIARHVHPMDFAGACRRALMVGENRHRFYRLWPDLRGRPRRPVKKAIFGLLSRPLFLPLAVLVGRVAARRGGGRLTMAVICLHEDAGARTAARRSSPGFEAPQPLTEYDAVMLEAA